MCNLLVKELLVKELATCKCCHTSSILYQVNITPLAKNYKVKDYYDIGEMIFKLRCT